MHLLLNDYAGHEFPVHLAKELTRRGDRVTHAHCSSNVTPHADFEAADRAGIDLRRIDLGRNFEKHRPWRRVIDEIDYGVRSAVLLARTRPDHVVAAQLPVISLLVLQLAALAFRVPMVLWLQDIQSEIAKSRSARIGRALEVLEHFAIRRASTIITISPEMAVAAGEINPRSSVKVIENWADVDKIQPGDKANAWAIDHGFDRTFNFVYSGTLGIKHRPGALAELATALRDHEDVQIIVVSEGAGTDQLRRIVAERQLANVELLPLQPATVLSDVLATADVMLALLEEDAANGCVPSKILAYLAAGRPILALFPAANLASRIVNDQAKAGFATDSTEDFTAAAKRLRSSPDLRLETARNARSYAEQTFDIRTIADQFQNALSEARA